MAGAPVGTVSCTGRRSATAGSGTHLREPVGTAAEGGGGEAPSEREGPRGVDKRKGDARTQSEASRSFTHLLPPSRSPHRLACVAWRFCFLRKRQARAGLEGDLVGAIFFFFFGPRGTFSPYTLQAYELRSGTP